MRRIEVCIEQRRVGELLEDGNWSFTYDQAWSQIVGSFDLAPGLPRTQHSHVDGEGTRSVQNYFENFLPEHELQHATFAEARISGEDTFALLEYLGEETTGALIFRSPGQGTAHESGLKELTDAQLSERIGAISKRTLSLDAPKRVAIAGAQHKLAIVMKDDRLFEPVGAAESTHILKPDHPKSLQYPGSAINEYVVMRLARAAGLVVPDVHLRYLPEPVYIVERFDRAECSIPLGASSCPSTASVHVVDACQLLDLPRSAKYGLAGMSALEKIISLTTDQDRTRMALYRWLVFNVPTGNDDAHLKNLSFFVSVDRITLAPHYDLLSTAVYRTRAITDSSGWPWVDMTIKLREADCFGQVTRHSMTRAAKEIGVSPEIAGQVIDDVIGRVSVALDAELRAAALRHLSLDEKARVHVAQEARVLRILKSTIVGEMSARMTTPYVRPDAF